MTGSGGTAGRAGTARSPDLAARAVGAGGGAGGADRTAGRVVAHETVPAGWSGPVRTDTLASDPLGGSVRRTVLPSGVRILTESVRAMRSVSFGVWVGVGSRDETPRLSGVSHFLEHLLFKGTRRRSALEISAEVEAVGGETNAFTTKEYTCYYARGLDAPSARDRRGLRPGHRLGAGRIGRGDRAWRDPGGDRHARGRAR